MNNITTFSVTYQLSASSKAEATERAEVIALEQSAEMPRDVIPKHLKDHTGLVHHLNRFSEKYWSAEILYPKAIVDGDPLQFLNVLFGNCSLYPGIKITDIDRSYTEEILPGPNFGIEGIRNLLEVPNRPLSCAVIKPIGLTPGELGKLAFKFASGGIDVIKDDHGLVNQSSAPFTERVQACVEAARNGEQVSGKKTAYFPNITSSVPDFLKNADTALKHGADGVLIMPQLTGLSALSALRNEFPELPVMAHPAFSGAYVVNPDNGISPEIYFGMLWRAFGADIIIYPNAGGRFSFSVQTCQSINRECRRINPAYPAALPAPGGGVSRESIGELAARYGNDTLFLIGGSLYQHPDGIKEAALEFQQTLEKYD